MRHAGRGLWERIGREPSGDPFNSLVQLEHEQGQPRNPFINAGAIAVADRLVSHGQAKIALLALLSSLCGEPVHFDDEVARLRGRHRLSQRGAGQLHEELRQDRQRCPRCWTSTSTNAPSLHELPQLARAAGYLCRDGAHPVDPAHAVITERQARRINALMLTCGTYDAAGEFAFRIGLPCKSGVGGGIVAVVPDRLTLCVWSPALDRTGNSLLGMLALEMFAARTGLSIF
jgi:glutaminase